MLYALEARLTILREPPSPGPSASGDPQALALAALVWVLGDEPRAERLLALTGLTPAELRAGLADPAVLPEMLGAVMEFLRAHEPDLVAAADALGVTPAELAATAERLSR